MKKILFLFSILSSALLAQEIDIVQCTYYMTTSDALTNQSGQMASFERKHKDNATVKMNGGSEFKFNNDTIRNKTINKEIAAIRCADSLYLNLKKIDREMGYALVRMMDTVVYIKSFLEASQNATSNAILFGVVGAMATKYNETLLILSRDLKVKETITKQDLRNSLKNLVDESILKNFKDETEWNIAVALKYQYFAKTYPKKPIETYNPY